MSVALRLILSLSTLVACTALLGAAALSGLAALGDRYRRAEDQYRDLRSLYEVGFHTASVRALLNAPFPAPHQIEQHLHSAAESARIRVPPRSVRRSDDSRASEIVPLRQVLESQLQSATAAFDAQQSIEPLRTDTNRWLAGVAALLPRLEDGIIANRQKALDEHRATLATLAVVVAATALIALAAGILLYRSVMGSLRNLERAASRFAAGDLAHRTPDTGDREFRRLAREFNRMGGTIHDLHSSMLAQVEAKSMALIRSERLAGVGFLAAGVAHEINNPLAIIAGHAQMTLRQTAADTASPLPPALATCRKTLTIITEEAFRCRDIVRQLLALAHPADDQPERLHPAALVHKALTLAKSLPLAADRHLHFRDDSDDQTVCRAHPPQILQVLINLLTNALEASSPGGRIEVSLDRSCGAAVISVKDDGCGMDAQTLAQAFDPFYTDKSRRGLTGTGLGLFVSHAIIQRHGGRLLATSDGPGKGSTFVIELPLCAAPANLTDDQPGKRDYVAAA